MAKDRGMGVADMTRTSGRLSFSPSTMRCRTPKRCCSSTTTSPEPVELHPLLDQGVGTHRDPARPIGDLLQGSSPLSCAQAPGEKDDIHSQRLQHLPELPGMLLREDLRRRHEGRLIPAFQGHEPWRRGPPPSFLTLRPPEEAGSSSSGRTCRRESPEEPGPVRR